MDDTNFDPNRLQRLTESLADMSIKFPLNDSKSVDVDDILKEAALAKDLNNVVRSLIDALKKSDDNLDILLQNLNDSDKLLNKYAIILSETYHIGEKMNDQT
ncbi:hypothetical protein CANCADRAFT_108 [Tortispora caseinolytica NRRL Y-17796]|uniref:Uncharacterized protein n=1 Tax=Tortispora caseinolytica NRRL Y-17796 TaxID=767744 RepID=A0A1E4TIF6_9ASCO|nr:hypothetical protein CANCADRAFT_108 [Tortispora caseinolytica NRRL Y-17796]